MRYPFLVLALAVAVPVTAHAEPLAAPSPGPRSETRQTALGTTFEVLSPIGGAGCFYRRRWLVGALVMAGSLIGGGLMIHGLVRGNGDEVSLNAVAYGVSRFIGIVAAARPEAAPAPLPPPSPRGAAALSPLSLSYAFSF